MSHIACVIRSNILVVPYDVVFLDWVKEIQVLFPHIMQKIGVYSFTSPKEFQNWISIINLSSAERGFDIAIYSHPVDLEKWADKYLKDQNWLDFDILSLHEDYLYHMENLNAPISKFFQSNPQRTTERLLEEKEKDELFDLLLSSSNREIGSNISN